MADLTRTELVGVDPDTLRQWLADAQAARQQLMIGGMPVSVSYAQGDGSKSVTRQYTSAAQLGAWIAQLQAQLGIGGRRPLRFIFR